MWHLFRRFLTDVPWTCDSDLRAHIPLVRGAKGEQPPTARSAKGRSAQNLKARGRYKQTGVENGHRNLYCRTADMWILAPPATENGARLKNVATFLRAKGEVSHRVFVCYGDLRELELLPQLPEGVFDPAVKS